ncbi:MAG: hypothetical protein LH614_18150 [Pyrinomonadaceae bacterium]|nr:hypothetical protein [Pyrinomonadaceae bacterium]
MSKSEMKPKDFSNIKTDTKTDSQQRGSAIVIALFVLVLISVFVALALSRTTAEAIAVGNETAEGRTTYAAQGSLEMMTRNFNKVFETRLSPADTDFDPLRAAAVPGITGYTFNQEVDRTSENRIAVIERDAFAGLYATRDNWRLRTTATDSSGVQVQLTRNIVNNRIPIFQFGIFYNDDLEFHPGPRFDFGGRVHSNGSLFMMAGTGLYFNSRVSAVGEIVTDIGRNGKPSTTWGENVFIKNGATDVQLKANMGSVLTTPASGTPVFQDLMNKPKLYNADMPVVYESASWTANQALFGGNLLARQKPLDLPLRISSLAANVPVDYIELIKRGRNVGDLYNSGGTPTAPVITPVTVAAGNADNEVTVSERYYNKTGIRISLADQKAKLPGCASGVGTAAIAGICGKRLDGDALGDSELAIAGTRGYQPLPMQPLADKYVATRLNGERFGTTGNGNLVRQMWIKIELVSRNPVNNAIITKDVTADILSLGVTEAAPCISGKFRIINPAGSTAADYYNGTCAAGVTTVPYIDSRSIIKLQRFVMPGENFIGTDPTSTAYMTNFAGWSSAYNSHSLVYADECLTLLAGVYSNCTNFDRVSANEAAHKKLAVVDDPLKFRRIVPFPIEMFDAREGIYNTDPAILNTGIVYGNKVPWAGVMSMVDVDVSNLRRFLSGAFDANMPATTKYAVDEGHVLRNHPTNPLLNDVPQNGGWVVYFSDRRGDSDFDGEYDMEDIYGNNDGNLQTGENVNNSPTTNANGGLDTNFWTLANPTGEAAKYTVEGAFNLPAAASPYTPTNTSSFVSPGYAASVDHPYYRRGMRLINAEVLPGQYDWANSDNTKGFTVASENGVYVQGNYNSNGISSVGTPTESKNYLPQGRVVVGGVVQIAEAGIGANHIPASIASDAITILSNYNSTTKNGWTDSNGFLFPFTGNARNAVETFTRFAILAGDSRSSYEALPNQGIGDPRLGGGVHNFKHFLEDWGGVRLNYAGSLINLYNARNNNGSYKSDGVVYSPPTRNWIFDSSFLDPTRLPPGTPYFQFVQTSGFQRTND